MGLIHEELTGKIPGGFYDTYDRLGHGFLERIYESALAIELEERGFKVRRQAPIAVHFEGKVLGHYLADMVVDDLVLIEIKAVQSILKEHEAQLVNYLKATRYEVGLLLNFGPEACFKRRILENSRKGNLDWLEKT